MKTKQRIPSLLFLIFFCGFSAIAQVPRIDVQPQNQIVIAGSNITFTVKASGAGVPDLPQVDSGTLRLWLRADAGVITDDDFVTEWQDQSANGNHASQSSAAAQPLLVNNAVPFSGQPVVRFDGIQDDINGDFLRGAGDLDIPNAFTSFLVYSVTQEGNAEQIPSFVGVPGAYGGSRGYYIYNGQMAFSSWTYDYSSGFVIPTNTFRIWTDRYSTNRDQIEFFDATSDTSTNISRSIGGQITPGPGYHLGGFDPSETAGRNFGGDIAELIYYRGALSEADRLAVENYLKLKYFQASVAGGGSLSYQWKFNETNIDGATSKSLTITNARVENNGTYSVSVSNNFGGTESESAMLTVKVPPAISVQPQSQSVLPGTNATFTITATGTPPFSYQWFFKGIMIPGATDSTYTVYSAQFSDAGNYSVIVSNSVGSAKSDNAGLRVPAPPLIFSQSGSQIVLAGTSVTLAVTAETIFPNVASGKLRLWLKADEGPIVEDGRVVEWIDQSTNANHAFQADANKQPAFINSVSAISGWPAVHFDGIQNAAIGDWMHGTGNLDLSNAYTSFLVYSRGDTNVSEQILAAVGVPAQRSRLRSYYIRNQGEMAFAAWSNDYGTGYLIPPSTFRIWTQRLNTTQNFLEFFDVTATNSLAFTRNVGGLATPDAGYYLGGLGDYTRNFRGDISEFIVYQSALTDADRIAVQDYLKAKYYFGAGDNAITYQWQVNGTNVPGATNAALVLANAQPQQSGIYTVALTNLAGSVSSVPANIDIRYLFARGNGQRLTNYENYFVAPATVTFESYFPNGMIFYTLDGSTPTFASESYIGPLALTKSATVRAIVYSSDFLKSGESIPVNVNIVPTYALSTVTSGGGSVTVHGTGPFLSNSVVGVTANASAGWTFLQWLDDATGTNSTTDIKMTRNKSVRAVFGTSLSATAAGNGSVAVHPAGSLYPYGSVVRLTATPQPGNYFGIWGNAANGNVNPLYFTITNANPTVSSLFSTLNSGQFSLTLSVSGSGRASVTPRANAYNNGQLVTLTAIPDAGQTFLGWSDDASGTANPLNVTMNQSRFVTANFTKNPRLSVKITPSTFALEGLQLFLSGEPGETYSLQKSTNLTDWSTIDIVTNSYGTIELYDWSATNSNEQFYRAVQP